jgi:hypothetical protein
MPVKMFGRLCETMMLQFEKEGDGLDSVDVPIFLQRYVLVYVQMSEFPITHI